MHDVTNNDQISERRGQIVPCEADWTDKESGIILLQDFSCGAHISVAGI